MVVNNNHVSIVVYPRVSRKSGASSLNRGVRHGGRDIAVSRSVRYAVVNAYMARADFRLRELEKVRISREVDGRRTRYDNGTRQFTVRFEFSDCVVVTNCVRTTAAPDSYRPFRIITNYGAVCERREHQSCSRKIEHVSRQRPRNEIPRVQITKRFRMNRSQISVRILDY